MLPYVKVSSSVLQCQQETVACPSAGLEYIFIVPPCVGAFRFKSYAKLSALWWLGGFSFEFAGSLHSRTGSCFIYLLNTASAWWAGWLSSCKLKGWEISTFPQWMLWLIYQTALNGDAGDVSDLKTVKLCVNSDESCILLLQIKHTI